MGVGDMKLHEFKAKFRLRKENFQQGTHLRLIVRNPSGERGYERWDQDTEAYLEEMEEEVMDVAEKYGIEIEIAKRALFEKILT